MKMKSYDEYKSEKHPVVGIVGLPSGEYIELTPNQFMMMNETGMLDYNSHLKTMTFSDLDYHNIMFYLKDSKKESIKKFLQVINCRDYKINDDYTIDVVGSVKIRMPLNKLPFKFELVMGDFDISSCGLITLEGCPEEVEGNFICTNNRLTNLKGGPKIVGGDYDVKQSDLSSLLGAPQHIKKDFDACYNNLTNLKGSPQIVDGSFYVANCLLDSLEGSPDIISNDFDCSYNILEYLTGGPDMMAGTYNCSNNDIITLKGGPNNVGVFKCNGNRRLRDLDFAPVCGRVISDEI